jgi:hypothetical protein
MFSRTLKPAIEVRARVTDGLLAGDQRQILGRHGRLLGIGRSLRQRPMLMTTLSMRGNLHLVVVLELFAQRLADGLVVDRLEARADTLP